jgi:NAD(P)H-dependent FMN reductase
VGLPIGNWLRDQAINHGKFEVRVADLAVIGLPFFDEPEHPSQQKYTKPHTFAWSETVAAANAFAIVMPEYNHSFTAPLKNAIDFLSKEWANKPVGLVTYGGVSGGLRAGQAIKPVLGQLRMLVVPETVVIQGVGGLVSDGTFNASDHHRSSAGKMLDELARVTPVLKQLG